MKKIFSGALFLLFFASVDASAQIMSNPAQWYINNQIYSTRVFNGVVANSMLRGKAGRGNRSKSANKTATMSCPRNLPPKPARTSAKPNKSSIHSSISIVKPRKRTAFRQTIWRMRLNISS
jgi:hypothetical protein